MFLFSVFHIHIVLIVPDRFISGTDDLSVVGEFLHAVSAPADDTRDREDRGEKLLRESQHVINKTGIKVYIDADALIDLSLVCDDLGGEFFHEGVQVKLLLQSLLHGQFFHEVLENDSPGIGFGVHCMSDTIDKPGMVKGLLI